jgi:prepilin-type N-terminal cleavage/methylation domain-containing protein
MKALRMAQGARSKPRSVPWGFTLLEIMIALSIFVMIMTGIFAIAKSSMDPTELHRVPAAELPPPARRCRDPSHREECAR